MEAIAEATSARTLGQLENYFSSYGDLPREIILKHDLLRVGHWFTDAALELASQALVKSYRLFSYDLMAMKDMKRKEHRKIPEWLHDSPRPVRTETGEHPDDARFEFAVRHRCGGWSGQAFAQRQRDL